eukprot:TRINITY_DN3361_c0_g1_i1.p1 TRINITY_DN3361_c0_g1~~TRINITY_DN3361_c0_g1_i1.p1  ORF type:complete len:583 (-),score=90.94 TRINITY_DN3361_c0_g1_i1:4775-6523(-)
MERENAVEKEMAHIRFLIARCKYTEAEELCKIAMEKYKTWELDFAYLKAEALEGRGNFDHALEILSNLKAKGLDVSLACSRIESRLAKPDVVMIPSEEEDLYNSYTQWMKAKGAKFDKIDLKYFYEDYRGVVAKEDVLKDEDIIFVPVSVMITLKMAKQSPVGKKLVDKKANLIYPNNSFLSTFVLYEAANPKSPWRLFFSTLPKSVSTFPIFLTEAEKALLAGSPFLRGIEELKQDMKHDYKQICKAAPEFSKIATLEDFMRTRALVNSRIFGISIEGEDNDSIVPYADMFNFKHGCDMTTWAYSDEAKGFVVKSKENIKAGEEIFVYYGNKPNWNFFQFYGFVIDNNEKDEILLEVLFLLDDPLSTLKESLLDCIKEEPQKLKLRETASNKKFSKAISYLRYIAYNDTAEQLKEIKKKCDIVQEEKGETVHFTAFEIPPISATNEERALEMLKKLCEKNLARYPQSYEYDVEALKNPGLSYNERNCIIFRKGEKRVHNFHIRLATEVINVLKTKSKFGLAKVKVDFPKAKAYLESIESLIQQWFMNACNNVTNLNNASGLFKQQIQLNGRSRRRQSTKES